MAAIVTRDSLQALIDQGGEKQMHVVGRALVRLLERQTAAEQASDSTLAANGVGFSGFDAHTGTLTAKAYLRRKMLEDWQVKQWTRKGKNGYSRLTRYHKQLNDVAVKKAGG